MNFQRCFYALVFSGFLTAQSLAAGVRNLRIANLITTADVIAVARVAEVNRVGPAQPILFRNQPIQAEAYSAALSVERIIKGSAPDRIVVNYPLPIPFIGYQGLHRGTRLVFLRRDANRYSLADPYYPDFPATLLHAEVSSTTAAPDYAGAVLREMLSVIASATASSAEKSEILRVDYALPSDDEVVTAFRAALTSAAEPDFRQRLQGELIRFGDLSQLPDVAHLLLANLATENQRIWLLYVIGNRVKDQRAIPALRPLLSSSDDSIREAAVEALWHIADYAAAPALIAALKDADERVRFYAVRGLSDIAPQIGWGGPSEPEFHEHQQKYLTHWQDWAKSSGLEP